MADPLVETKLLVPRPRRETVARPRLAALLDRASEAPVTVVSAPAGFGKTTLISTWLTARINGLPGSAALRTRGATRPPGSPRPPRPQPGDVLDLHPARPRPRRPPDPPPPSLTLLRSRQAPIETVLAGVVNELSVHPGEVTSVLDDYHLADGPDIAEALTFLVDHLPPPLRLVISTRADPALPLSRLRARRASPRSVPPTCASPPRRSRATSTTCRAPASATTTSRPWRPAPRWAAALQLAALRCAGEAPGVHRRIRRRRPVRRGLPRRRGAGSPTRGRAPLPARNLHPRPPLRTAAARCRQSRARRPRGSRTGARCPTCSSGATCS